MVASLDELALQAEASNEPSGAEAMDEISLGWKYNFCISGHNVFLANSSSVGISGTNLRVKMTRPHWGILVTEKKFKGDLSIFYLKVAIYFRIQSCFKVLWSVFSNFPNISLNFLYIFHAVFLISLFFLALVTFLMLHQNIFHISSKFFRIFPKASTPFLHLFPKLLHVFLYLKKISFRCFLISFKSPGKYPLN